MHLTAHQFDLYVRDISKLSVEAYFIRKFVFAWTPKAIHYINEILPEGYLRTSDVLSRSCFEFLQLLARWDGPPQKWPLRAGTPTKQKSIQLYIIFR